MIGLSLSFCVRDIVDGLVKYDEVEMIVTGTHCRTPADWQTVIGRYVQVYWAKKPAECVEVLRRLLADNKISQPRLHGGNGPNISDGWWAKTRKPETETVQLPIWNKLTFAFKEKEIEIGGARA